MNTDKEFVPYEPSLDMKELGFDEPCFGHYQQEWHDDGMTQLEPSLQMIVSKQHQHAFQLCSAPTYSQAFRWFREKYDLQCWPEPTGSDRYSCRYDGNDETGYRWVGYLRNDNKEILFYLTYEEAELACLKKLIELVKK